MTYGEEFSKRNATVGVIWCNRRDAGLCRLGIQVMPLLLIIESLFSDADYVKELVNWAKPGLHTDGWKAFAYVLEAIYDKETALRKTKRLKASDSGNSSVDSQQRN
ncbi:hypothetical protein L6164_017111 [Bauhinia variegata]|uniref:Uncharacterized protein n=1 Tax=Bauhinia variegata TaxID=167791 RepID=A0ACB9N7G9_BAUVA|nr:hypothetical protein L6164_017111 [Bauhinia variegata]